MKIIREISNGVLIVGSNRPLPPTMMYKFRSYVKTPSEQLQMGWEAANYKFVAMYSTKRPPSPYSDESEDGYEQLRYGT